MTDETEEEDFRIAALSLATIVATIPPELRFRALRAFLIAWLRGEDEPATTFLYLVRELSEALTEQETEH